MCFDTNSLPLLRAVIVVNRVVGKNNITLQKDYSYVLCIILYVHWLAKKCTCSFKCLALPGFRIPFTAHDLPWHATSIYLSFKNSRIIHCSITEKHAGRYEMLMEASGKSKRTFVLEYLLQAIAPYRVQQASSLKASILTFSRSRYKTPMRSGEDWENRCTGRWAANCVL